MDVGDFKLGDRVYHASMGSGTVVLITDRGIHVEFDSVSERSGKPKQGIYDKTWFRLNADLMSRPTTPER